MSLVRHLVVTSTNDIEGISLSLKTVAVGDYGVYISGDMGLYNIQELKAALEELEKFVKPKGYISHTPEEMRVKEEVKPPESEL